MRLHGLVNLCPSRPRIKYHAHYVNAEIIIIHCATRTITAGQLTTTTYGIKLLVINFQFSEYQLASTFATQRIAKITGLIHLITW